MEDLRVLGELRPSFVSAPVCPRHPELSAHLATCPLGIKLPEEVPLMLMSVMRMLCLASASASFLTPLPAQARQPGSVARSAVQMLPPAAPTAEEKARKSFVQTEMRSECQRTEACTLARHRPAVPARAATRPALLPTRLATFPTPHALQSHPPPLARAPSKRPDVRPGAAMKLHTRDQAPKEGQQPAEKPVAKWEPGRAEYLQFLVDSRCRPPPTTQFGRAPLPHDAVGVRRTA